MEMSVCFSWAAYIINFIFELAVASELYLPDEQRKIII